MTPTHYPSCVRCMIVFDREMWEALPIVGVQKIADGNKPDELELRNCKCGSTLSRWIGDQNE